MRRSHFVEFDSKCLKLGRKSVERKLTLLSFIEISLDLDKKIVGREVNFVS